MGICINAFIFVIYLGLLTTGFKLSLKKRYKEKNTNTKETK